MKLVVGVLVCLAGVQAEARPLTNIVQLAAGTDHACALLGSGEVVCWGDVEPAPAAANPHAPALVPEVQGAIAIAAAASGTCALLKGGQVWCWGVDWYIGRSQKTVGHGRQPPDAVTGISDAVEVAMGLGFGGACARHRDGRVSCWGDNRYGHLGTPTKVEHNVEPVRVPGITTAVELAVGITGVCARLRSGAVMCWGTGDETTASPPALVRNITDAVGITVGQEACALRKTGKVTCWKIDDASAPHTDPGVSDAIALRDNGVSLQCAIKKDRTLACWGHGLEGVGGVTAKVPAAIPNLADVKQVAPGGRFACALVAGGTATCWGTNYIRQLGRDTPSIVGAPAGVLGVAGARTVAVGRTLACALTAAGVTCWGSGRPATAIANTADAEQVAIGDERACVRNKLGKVACWEVTSFGPAVDEPALDNARHLAVDGNTACVARQDGSVKCTDTDRGWSMIRDATSVTADFAGGCARSGNGDVTCWGSRVREPSGQRTRSPRAAALVATGMTQIDADGPLCMLQRTGVRCQDGVQIRKYDGVRGGTELAAIEDRDVVQVATGWAHACVRRKTGSVACWGYHHGGQLGSGAPFDDQPRAQLVPVKLAAPAIDLAARSNTTCAVLRGGTVTCWGTNRDGQVGDGTFGNVYTPGAPVEAP